MTFTSTFSVNLRGGVVSSSAGGSDTSVGGGSNIGPMGKGKSSSAFDAKAGELCAMDDQDEPIETPILLGRLNANVAPSRSSGGNASGGGAMGGI